jgi:hypothetical protein
MTREHFRRLRQAQLGHDSRATTWCAVPGGVFDAYPSSDLSLSQDPRESVEKSLLDL